MLSLQGQILRRHKAVKEDGSQVTPLDMEVGGQIAIYGRRYQIMDCDQFTRDWYSTLMSIEHAPAIAYPADPLATFKASRSRKKASLGPPSCRTDDMTRFNEARLGKPTNVLDADSLRQFLVRSRRQHATCFAYGYLKQIVETLSKASMYSLHQSWACQCGAWIHMNERERTALCMALMRCAGAGKRRQGAALLGSVGRAGQHVRRPPAIRSALLPCR